MLERNRVLHREQRVAAGAEERKSAQKRVKAQVQADADALKAEIDRRAKAAGQGR